MICEDCLSQLKEKLRGKRLGLLIGAHRKFSLKELDAIEGFIETYDTTVFYDHASNYHGKNRVLISVASDLKHLNVKPDIVIDIGSITGVYSTQLLFKGSEFWRISEDGEFHQRYHNLRKQFECPECLFFSALADKDRTSAHKYYDYVMKSTKNVIVPDLPLSNTFISLQVSKKLPKDCSLHLGILNSLRNMDFFELDESIDSSCNVGGFGIDGAVSTLVGQSMVNKNRLYFGQIGDLAFFYDMNALGIRHISNNIRLLIINNGRGVEFRVNSMFDGHFGNELDEFIAAGGHYGSAKAWAKSMGFEYLTASNKDEFMAEIDNFCSADINRYDKPVSFEVFTTVKGEQDGLCLIREANKSITDDAIDKTKKVIKRVVSKKVLKAIKNFRKG